MKKFLFAFSLIFLFALLMGGSCQPKEDAPTDLPSTTEQPTTPTEEPTEPEVPEQPTVTPITETAFQIVYFDFDKYNIRSDARNALEHNARVLRDNLNVRVKIEGHCDERGTVEYNLALGERRAKSVKDYLINLGIDASRIETISFGKEQPADLGHNEEAWQNNRRAKFSL